MARTEELALGSAAEPASRARDDARSKSGDRALYWIALTVAVAAVAALAVWTISPRFAIDTPSLVDDWASLSRSGDALGRLVRLQNPEASRFVPSLTVWNYLQWHTFDAPQGLVGPNVWGILRALVLVAGLCLLTAVVLPVRPGRWNAALDASLAAIPAFAVVTVPKFARDLARFGPQEPLLVGGMALGGALLVLATRSLFAVARPVDRWPTAALSVAGSAFWLLGTYHKETSVCAIPLIAGAVVAGRSRLRAWPLLSRERKLVLGLIAAVVSLPLVHVAVATARLAARGDLIYGADVGGGNDLLDGFMDLYDWAHEPLPENARLLMWSALVLTGVTTVVRRRIDPVAVGALASGLLSLVAAGQSGVLATRYYIPAYALFALAFALSIARLPAPVRVAGALCVFFAFVPSAARQEVQRWTDEEQAGAAVVREVRALESARCTLAVDAIDRETTEALPVLVGLERRRDAARCESRGVFLLLPPGGAAPLGSACATGELVTVVESPLVTLYRCDRLRRQPILDPELGVVEPEQLVELHRFDSSLD